MGFSYDFFCEVIEDITSIVNGDGLPTLSTVENPEASHSQWVDDAIRGLSVGPSEYDTYNSFAGWREVKGALESYRALDFNVSALAGVGVYNGEAAGYIATDGEYSVYAVGDTALDAGLLAAERGHEGCRVYAADTALVEAASASIRTGAPLNYEDRGDGVHVLFNGE